MYKVFSCTCTEHTTSGPRTYDVPIHLSSDNVEAVKILRYPSISVLTVFKPLEDITLQVNTGPSWALEASEYVLADVNAVEELTTEQLIGWDYEL